MTQWKWQKWRVFWECSPWTVTEGFQGQIRKLAPRKQQCASIRDHNLIHTEKQMTNITPFSKSKVKTDGAREHSGHLREQLEDAEILSSSFCLHLSLYRIGM